MELTHALALLFGQLRSESSSLGASPWSAASEAEGAGIEPTPWSAPPAREVALTFESVRKTFVAKGQRVEALRDVSLRIPNGSIFAIVGKSGAGKSTLFRCAATLETPDQGRVLLGEVDLARVDGASLRALRRTIGVVFQELHLLPSRTAAENVGLPLVLAGEPRARVAARVAELLAWVGLEDRAGSYPSQLSGGQRQRVAIARALATEPALLLCDEPTSALDGSTAAAALALLSRAQKELGITVVIITHDLRVVERVCTHAALLAEGRVVASGAVSTVLAEIARRASPEADHG